MKILFKSNSGEPIEEYNGAASGSLLTLAQALGLPLEGTCEGNMACATCHLIIDKATYAKLPAPSEEEEDMLDFVPDLTTRSRLGCQIDLSDTLDGMECTLPASVTV